MPSLLSAFGPLRGLYGFLKERLAADRERVEFAAAQSLTDLLRHAHFNGHKYRITLYMKSGRTLVGRMGSGDYVHEDYYRHLGTLVMIPEEEPADGVYYEAIHLRVSEVEAFLIQEVADRGPRAGSDRER